MYARSKPRRAPSIRGRLVGYLLLPLLLLLIVSIWADHRTFVTPMYDSFDRALSRAAVAIAAHVQQAPDGKLYVESPDRSSIPLRLPNDQTPPPMIEDAYQRHGPPMRFDPNDRPMSWMRLYPGARDSFL